MLFLYVLIRVDLGRIIRSFTGRYLLVCEASDQLQSYQITISSMDLIQVQRYKSCINVRTSMYRVQYIDVYVYAAQVSKQDTERNNVYISLVLYRVQRCRPTGPLFARYYSSCEDYSFGAKASLSLTESFKTFHQIAVYVPTKADRNAIESGA